VSGELQPGKDALRRNPSGPFISAVIHAIFLIAVAGVLHRATKLEPHRMPGTHGGLQQLTYYAPGSTHTATNTVQAKVVDQQKPTLAAKPLAKTPATQKTAALDAQRGDANAGQSGLGDGNITIALQKYFPYPKPSLISLPPGAAGDVILQAVIDEHGKITGLTLLAGLGPAIDNNVIQTVNQWTYTPATKDGVPVASVEELHFHYERRG
jgi:protein TonB